MLNKKIEGVSVLFKETSK